MSARKKGCVGLRDTPFLLQREISSDKSELPSSARTITMNGIATNLSIDPRSSEAAIWQQVLNYPLGNPEAEPSLSFVHKVMMETGWSQWKAEKVILEFRKFLFIRIVTPADVSIVPGLMVDEIWHIALLYTTPYHDMSLELLGRMFHHRPVAKLKDTEAVPELFAQTLEFYRRYFGEPPALWCYAKRRFQFFGLTLIWWW